MVSQNIAYGGFRQTALDNDIASFQMRTMRGHSIGDNVIRSAAKKLRRGGT
jgi:hypothetical protein